MRERTAGSGALIPSLSRDRDEGEIGAGSRTLTLSLSKGEGSGQDVCSGVQRAPGQPPRVRRREEGGGTSPYQPTRPVIGLIAALSGKTNSSSARRGRPRCSAATPFSTARRSDRKSVV